MLLCAKTHANNDAICNSTYPLYSALSDTRYKSLQNKTTWYECLCDIHCPNKYEATLAFLTTKIRRVSIYICHCMLRQSSLLTISSVPRYQSSTSLTHAVSGGVEANVSRCWRRDNATLKHYVRDARSVSNDHLPPLSRSWEDFHQQRGCHG